MRLHPAKKLFRELFKKAASVDNPYQPSYFVPRGHFHDQCRKAGIDCPKNVVDAWNWEIAIGLPQFVKREIAAWRKANKGNKI